MDMKEELNKLIEKLKSQRDAWALTGIELFLLMKSEPESAR